MKRNILLYITLIAGLLGFASCEKKDINGDLDGQWQLMRWEAKANDSIIADGPTRLYWTVKLQLVKISGKANDSDKSMPDILSEYRYTGDSLILTQAYARPDDHKVELSELKTLGVPADGRMKIESLDSRSLVLSSDENVLYFRKNN